jgi:hypothetical protein
MSNPTSNFGWQMPTPTDLVTDLPADFEVFGQAVDTSMADLKGGTTGQILSKATDTDMDFVWIANDQGDITGVTAGTGISGGGTSGTVTITNSMATEITAKGDLIVGTGSATFDNLAAGSNGQTLVADSSTSTGLRYQSNFAAGKNQCINGAFNVWQRGTSFGANVYTADRWATQTDKGTTVSQQTFTAGTAPVAGYEGTFFLRQAYTATGNYAALQTKLEDVRLFAGQTITLSYWAKADATFSNTPSISQNFGSGGSSSVGTNGTTHNITTSWTRYSSVITVPSISGKTIGTSSFLMLQPILLESTGARTIDIWGVQVEAGSVATAFQTATGTIQGELAACQRYYFRTTASAAYSSLTVTGQGNSTTIADCMFPVPATMRTTPTSVDYANIALSDEVAGTYTGGTLSISASVYSNQFIPIRYTHGSASLTTYRVYKIIANNNTSAYVGVSAEL